MLLSISDLCEACTREITGEETGRESHTELKTQPCVLRALAAAPGWEPFTNSARASAATFRKASDTMGGTAPPPASACGLGCCVVESCSLGCCIVGEAASFPTFAIIAARPCTELSSRAAVCVRRSRSSGEAGPEAGPVTAGAGGAGTAGCRDTSAAGATALNGESALLSSTVHTTAAGTAHRPAMVPIAAESEDKPPKCLQPEG
mmetsp:Transcript_68641/g.192406  ORF Transcript_68641/g.192406 Transcript_68641/m.192406 type:complete len:205 (+) Transcript_68641:62-676(+)